MAARSRFQGMGVLSPEVRNHLARRARVMICAPDMLVIDPERRGDGVLVLLSGRVRLHGLSGCGCRSVIYCAEAREGGEGAMACVMAPCFGPVRGMAETHVEALDIPGDVVADMMTRSRGFRAFMFGAWSRPMSVFFSINAKLRDVLNSNY